MVQVKKFEYDYKVDETSDRNKNKGEFVEKNDTYKKKGYCLIILSINIMENAKIASFWH